MLRGLSIIGIVIFAVLIGVSSNSLRKMYESGELLNQYNSARRSNITLLVFSSIGIGALGYLELQRIKLLRNRARYGRSHYKEGSDENLVKDTSNIYSAPKTQDAWKGRRTKSPNSHKSSSVDSTVFWKGLLNACCVGLPLLYSGLLTYHLIKSVEQTATSWMLPALFVLLLVLSILMAIGILGRKPWGLNLGYLLAICNLLVFPYGTAAGLFLLIALVGTSSVFIAPDRDKRKKPRRKAAPGAPSSII